MHIPKRSDAVFRLPSRNLFVALGVGLSTLMVSAAISMWLTPVWMYGRKFGSWPAGLLYWYIILGLPTLVVAFVHQLALSALPHDWPPRRERIVILSSSLGVGLLVGAYATSTTPEVNWVRTMSAIVLASLVYGLLVRPLRPSGNTVTRAVPFIYLGLNIACALVVLSTAHHTASIMAEEQRMYLDFGDTLNFLIFSLPVLLVAMLMHVAWGAKAITDVWRRRSYQTVAWLIATAALWVAVILYVRAIQSPSDANRDSLHPSDNAMLSV